MEQAQHDTTEVLIVGAGPTGLMMACQLAVYRVSFRIIDKNTTTSQNSGALIVQARTLEIFQQLGIANEAISQGIIADRIDILYNAKKIAGTSIRNIGSNLSQFPFLLMLEQSKTEKLLLKFLEERGCYVERNVQFKSFTEDKDGISTKVITRDGSGKTIVSKYIIGADGSKSAIRDFLNIPFEGKMYARPIFILDTVIAENTSNIISFAFSKVNVAGFFPLGNQRWRVDGNIPERVKRSEKITLETVTKGLQHWTNLNMSDTAWFSVSHSQQKYARTIRVGNCFLAGDSAHVNTPVGAQGMNAGIQDAHNLAWKLAFVLKQKAKTALLDSYSSERLGITKGFARYADFVYRLMTNTNIAMKLFRTYAMKMFFRTIFPILVNKKELRMSFFISISQINIRYKPPTNPPGDLEKMFLHRSPMPYSRFPYMPLNYDNKNTNSHQILNPCGFTLLVLAEDLPPEMKLISDKYDLTTLLIKHVSGTDILYTTLSITNTGYYLIRPDMYIELRSATLETEILERYLHQLLIDKPIVGL